MPKNLVIVESPAKAKTIEKYLGKEFAVKSSYGHVRDLPKGNNAIDIKNGFTPHYVVSDDKKQVVEELRRLCRQAEIVWLATDDDREGEAIAWHLKDALELPDSRTKRIVFREITKNAILKAIDTPRTINQDLVNAQQARRILDRLVGYEISPVLWKKIQSGLSAGRVQSVAARLVVEREREVEKFAAEPFFKVVAEFSLPGGKKLTAELGQRFQNPADAEAFLKRCQPASFTVESLQKKPGKRSPAAPFTTSTLQQEASRKLSFSVAQTMTIAQRLYESGYISYMRTDSVNLSDEAIRGATAEVAKAYGEAYVQARQYKTKSKSAQEAHEAIRPTDFAMHSVPGERNDQRLYELIWKRAIASQMAEAELEKTIATINISTTPEKLVATGEVIRFEGFLKVYAESSDDENQDEGEGNPSGMLPPLNEGQMLDLSVMKATERYTRPPARYTEASLVKKLEEMGIGRPSTYAPTISTIQKRGYVLKDSREGTVRTYAEWALDKDRTISRKELSEVTGAEKSKLFPTNIGMVVNDFLFKFFSNIVDYSFTAKAEEQFDGIANGKTRWEDMIQDFYAQFHATVEKTTENVDRSDAGASRVLGPDPKTGREVSVKLGRFGPYVQIEPENPDEKPQYASLRQGQYMESISLDDALELFKLPREVGVMEDKTIVAAIGKFGPYLRHADKFISLPKEHDPLTVDLNTAIQVILAKREEESKKLIRSYDEDPDLKVLNGRWGPYIAYKKDNYKIPKGTEVETLTYQQCLEIIENTPDKKKPAPKGKGAKDTPAEKETASAKAPAKRSTAKTTAKTPAKKAAAAQTTATATKKKVK